MRNHLVCIKLGGSVITDKTKPLTPRPAAIKEFADAFHALKATHEDIDFLLGNGVGSYAHGAAHEYKLKDGAHTAEQWYGASVIHAHTRRLNLMVADELTESGLAVFPISPGDALSADDTVVQSANIETVRGLLAHSVTPLMHGDVIVDTARGVSIYATEQSLLWYAQQLRAEYKTITVITITTTGGVLNAMQHVVSELGRTDAVAELASTGHDVTGNMAGKVATLRAAADWADAVYIIGNDSEQLSAAVEHKAAGTRVL